MPNFSEMLETARNTKSTRIWFMTGLVVIVFVLWWLKVIKTGFAIGLGIILLAAIGIETFDYDLDLGKLWETGNIQESRVSHANGLTLFGSCAIPKQWANDLNCSNFNTQGQAQEKYEQCASEIASYNAWVDIKKIKSLDIYRLDWDKDGIVCEALPKNNKETLANTGTVTSTGVTSSKKSGTQKSWTTSTKNTTTTKRPTYSDTPLLRTGNPYPISPATIKTNPQTLPAQ